MIKIKIAVILICLILISSCVNFKEIKCDGISGFKINKINLQGIDATVSIKIKNPNWIGGYIYSGEFDVKYEGIDIGSTKLIEKVFIEANSEKSYEFNFKSDFKQLDLMDIMKLISGISAKRNIELKGDLYVGRFYIKKKIPILLKENVGLK